MDKVCDDRRRADMDPSMKIRGETSKTSGKYNLLNVCGGYYLMIVLFNLVYVLNS